MAKAYRLGRMNMLDLARSAHTVARARVVAFAAVIFVGVEVGFTPVALIFIAIAIGRNADDEIAGALDTASDRVVESANRIA